MSSTSSPRIVENNLQVDVCVWFFWSGLPRIILVYTVEGGCRDIASTICGQMSIKEIALLQN